jgi:hypothetical protein
MKTLTLIALLAFTLSFSCGKVIYAKASASGSANQIIAKMNEWKKTDWGKFTHNHDVVMSLDTVFVGIKSHDTLRITGNYSHTGPIFIFNDGVLIIKNAKFTNIGDVFIFGHGTLQADSSSLTFPQNYFYERSLAVVQHGTARFNTCRFNYSGIQHNMGIADSGSVVMNNVHQNDWTTAGLSSHATLQIHGLNLGGEYILSDSSTTSFSHVDTLILWHQLPNTAVINFAFPQGDTVMNYAFNNTIAGVSGIHYTVHADTCHTVWWAMMPVNGSNVTISNSNIRAIGTWFQHGDSVTVTGIKDNTFYANVVLPLPDRNLHLLNCNVQTWSLYVFDSSQINIYNCTVGEVGAEQHAKILSQQFLLDGSGGYFWASDTSVIFAFGVTIYSTARSEHNGIFVLSNSTVVYLAPSSIGNSLFVSVQNTLPADPFPYDHSAMWMEYIDLASSVHTDSAISVRGSAWIDQGPQGSWMDFKNYSLFYQKQGATAWKPIVTDLSVEIRHSVLGVWNTGGLDTGTYRIRLLVRNTLSDSVEDIKVVSLLPSGISEVKEMNGNYLSAQIFPNPASDYLNISLSEDATNTEIKIYDLLGDMKIVAKNNETPSNINIAGLTPGIYTVEIRSNNKIFRQKFIKQ